jgi:mRNA interferase RelE/StbE
VPYKVTWSATARKHLLGLDKSVRPRVLTVVGKLADDPRPHGIAALVGMPGVLRVRLGDYRVLYSVDDAKRQVWIEDVRHRSKAYGATETPPRSACNYWWPLR